MCLQQNCLQVGCPENVEDHSTLHYRANPSHAVHMNLSSQRLWCYMCEREVFFTSAEESHSASFSVAAASGASEEPDYDSRRQFGGLVGLKNLGNTCYMNAALQALSNSPPLTGYFLDCGSIVETLQLQTPQQKKSELAKGFHRLIKEMWWRNRRGNG